MMYMSIALKMIVGAVGLLFIVRLIGKKAISELTPFDLCVGSQRPVGRVYLP
nr:hypothetical protein [Atopococcus tabaci]